MGFYQKNQNNKRLWYSPIMLFILFCIVLIFMYNMVGLVEKAHETSKKKDTVSTQIDTLRARESALEGDIAKLKTAEGTEEALRAKYQVVKTGEKMVVIVDEKSATTTPPEKSSSGFLNFFKNLFK